MSTAGYPRGTARVLACAAAAARLRAARAVQSCAGAYVSGAAGSNECPAGSVRIETEAACRTAVAAARKAAETPFVEASSSSPRGCYYKNTQLNTASFNTHAVGAGLAYSQLLCAAVTTGAPVSDCACASNGNRVRQRTLAYCTVSRAAYVYMFLESGING